MTPTHDIRDRPLPAVARNMSPIVPRASMQGRALVAVVAIMAFLASMTTGAVLLVRVDMMPFVSGSDANGADLERLERGLMYVAMTRAEDMLAFTQSTSSGFGATTFALWSITPMAWPPTRWPIC